MRLILIIVTHTFYRLRVTGRTHVPETGGVLLTPNHVSFVDGLFLITATDRPIRFIVESSYFEKRLLKPFLTSMRAIPISASGGPRMILRALKDAGKFLDDGHVVCIFAEGQLTRTGMLLPFRRGLERVVKGRTAPIVPVYLDRVWGSIFSRERGRYVTKLPYRLPYPVSVVFGTPLQTNTPIHRVRQSVMELAQIAWQARKDAARPLHRDFVRGARRYPFSLALADIQRADVTRAGALVAAVSLARALRSDWGDQKNVGILLPTTAAGAMVNIAASLSGRTSVNLNDTAGRAGMESAAKQAGLKTVVTSRAFLDKAKIALPDGVTPVWIEQLAIRIGLADRLWAALLGFLAPYRLLERACGAARPVTCDDVATIIFSSGSTGEPKGVMLSHFNVGSNIVGLSQIFSIGRRDRIMGILPLFHSFGYMSLWFAANNRMGLICHPNPLDAPTIGGLIEKYRATFLLATPTFLQIYLRRCTPAQFGSLRLVMAGAEKLPDRLSLAFEEQFGIRPLEGYGATECSPVIAASTLDFRAPGFYQPGSRRGYVGHPLPGVAVRIVDPETGELKPPDEPGMLLVKGPNVMQGYIGRDDLTALVIKDGWYTTGDIATMGEDGFIKITGRLSRFSKIGGEMVPHGKVEEALQDAAGSQIQVFAVTGVPDAKKGERLAVLHTMKEEDIPTVIEKMAGSGLPNLFIPRADQFYRVEALPMLGTGKLDLRGVKAVALERAGVAS